jgi:hypothetical protein
MFPEGDAAVGNATFAERKAAAIAGIRGIDVSLLSEWNIKDATGLPGYGRQREKMHMLNEPDMSSVMYEFYICSIEFCIVYRNKNTRFYGRVSPQRVGVQPLGFPIRKLYNRPFSTPSPLPRTTVTASSLSGFDPFIFAFWKPNDYICFASSQRKDTDARSRAHRTNSFYEWCGCRPCRLVLIS